MKKSNKPLIIGSIAFDIIFSIRTDFREAIPLENGKIEHFNASYTAQNPHQRFGGNGGNVGYWLSTLQTPFHLLSSFGKDLHASGYYDRLVKMGGDVRGIEEDYTAMAYMISDPLNQQCIIWQPNAWEQITNDQYQISNFYDAKEIQSIDYALLSVLPPGVATKLARELKQINPSITIILDTGQVTTLYDLKSLERCLRYVDILTCNEVEYLHFGKAYHRLMQKSPWEEGQVPLIHTLGSDGCRLVENGVETHFHAYPCQKAIEPTGAGDAFRAGILAGLCEGKSLSESIPLGLTLGAQCVEIVGPQGD
ncbi:MAG TPA: PfkB family carbohydrate kinase [Candidatus Gracilibacteria bacterium]